MPVSKPLLFLLNLALCICGWFLVFKTETFVTWARRRYVSRRYLQHYPFARMVMKPWYPTYLRIVGVLVWVVVAGLDCILVFARWTH